MLSSFLFYNTSMGSFLSQQSVGRKTEALLIANPLDYTVVSGKSF